jgi:GT2 family glycosyltransferase
MIMIHICILTVNRPNEFRRCIESIEPALRRDDVRLWTLEQGKEMGENYTFFVYKYGARPFLKTENLGCAGGRQYLLNWLTSEPDDIIVFLDDDLYATDDTWLDALTLPIRAGVADITGVDARTVTPDFNTIPALDHNSVDYVSGGWSAWSARVFLAGLRFDDRFQNYYEDVAAGIIAKSMGFRITGVSGVALHHEPHGFNVDILLRSRELFIQHYSGRGLISFEKGTNR